MTGFGALPQELANIGTGIGSNMASAAYGSQKPLTQAAATQTANTLGMFGGLGGAAQDIWGQKQATQQVQPSSGYRMIDGIGVSNYS
jgi:isocitrate/isopropylmalate dehydrogenase